jgi:hypothetical protein
MRRFLEQGLPIHFIHCRRDAAVPLEEFVAPALQSGYRSRRPEPCR